MSWLTGGSLGFVAAKAALMYVTALVALRVGERRTLAQWTIIDFATAVAMGAIIGRTAIAGSQSYATGAVALVTLVAVHRAASLLRFNRVFGKLADHRVRVLVAEGQVREAELRRCGLTDNDLFAQLRQHGVFTLDEVRYVLYEAKGDITVVRQTTTGDPQLVQAGLEGSAGYP
ncbi:MAG TPA: YetF domain-containing protein [Acidimicrobiales bacterium]|nr:YetF domain-containing protein [Acidimicrobiales bacterium]